MEAGGPGFGAWKFSATSGQFNIMVLCLAINLFFIKIESHVHGDKAHILVHAIFHTRRGADRLLEMQGTTFLHLQPVSYCSSISHKSSKKISWVSKKMPIPSSHPSSYHLQQAPNLIENSKYRQICLLSKVYMQPQINTRSSDAQTCSEQGKYERLELMLTPEQDSALTFLFQL